MELKEFIKEAVTEVLAGIALAQQAAYKEYGRPLVAPSWDQSDGDSVSTQLLELTATVTVVEETGGNVGLSIATVIKGGVKKDESYSKASTIKMQIPIVYPVFDPEQK